MVGTSFAENEVCNLGGVAITELEGGDMVAADPESGVGLNWLMSRE